MKNVITSLTSVNLPKGETISFKYSSIDEFGDTVAENVAKTIVVTDDTIIEHIKIIRSFLESKVK